MKKYDLHIHTNASKCSNLDFNTILKTAKKRKLNGIAITDHNVFKSKKFLNLNKDKDFEVILGEEVETDHGDVLGYYLTQRLKKRDFFGVVDEIKKQGGLVFIAHPLSFFRPHCSSVFLKQVKNKIDGIEIRNGREGFILPDIFSSKLANELNLCGIGGSDAHYDFEMGRVVTLIETNFRDYVKKKKRIVKGYPFFCPFGHALSFFKKRL